MARFKLSKLQRDSLLNELGDACSQTNELIDRTEYWIDTLRGFRLSKTSTPSAVRKTLSQIEVNATDVKALLEKVLQASYDEASVNRTVGNALSFHLYKGALRRDEQELLNPISRIIAAARAARLDWKPYKGKPRDDVTMWFVKQMANEYEVLTGRNPGKTKSHKGPFTRYLGLCLEIAGEPRSDPGDLIVKALPKKKSLVKLRRERLDRGG